jgi:hypothetical protein
VSFLKNGLDKAKILLLYKDSLQKPKGERMMQTKKVLAEGRKKGRHEFLRICREIDNHSAPTRARYVGSLLRQYKPGTVEALFKLVSWRRAPTDLYDKMIRVFPGLYEVVEKMGKSTDPTTVFYFFLCCSYKELGDLSPRSAWSRGGLRAKVLQLAEAYHTHGCT